MIDQDLLARVTNRLAQEKGIVPTSPSAQPETADAGAGAFQPEPLPDWGLNGPVGLLNSAGSGAIEAFNQTTDMIFGEPDQADKEHWRLQHDADLKQLRESGWQNNITAAISQFGMGLVGAGKLMAPIKGTSAVGRTAWEIARGAVAGFAVLDPHEERLSDLIQQYPALQNPITEYLASDPNDPAFVGRFKNAMEGIGFDLVAAGVIEASLRTLKFMRAGDTAGVEAAAKELEELQPQFDAQTAAREVATAVPLPPNQVAADAATESVDSMKPGAIAVPSGERSVADIDLPPAAPTARTGTEAIEPVTTEAAAIPLRAADQTYAPLVKIEDADVTAIIAAARTEAAAIKQFGSRAAAIEAGAPVPRADLPWKAMKATEDVQALVSSTSRAIQGQIDVAKGGRVVTDLQMNEMVQETSKHFDVAPDIVMAEIARSGEQATKMVADMEAAGIISQKMFRDAHDLSVRIKAGLLDEFGGDPAKAGKELVNRMTIAADMYLHGRTMTATFGRGLRRQRREFAVAPEDIARFKDIPPEKLAEILYSTGGDMAKLRQVANPSFMRRVIDEGAFLLTNNFLWNWVTHSVNLSTNMYMLAARPTEKILGSLMMGTKGSAIRRQAMKEYAYTIYSVSDAWTALVDTFLKADSKLIPYETEYLQAGLHIQQPELSLTAIKDTWDLFRNGLVAVNYGQAAQAALKGGKAAYRTGVGLPTRTLGAVDEFVKQLRYRAVVQARASVEGTEKGLMGADLKSYVSQKLSDAFTPDGRAIDHAASIEAQTTTFQQELGEGTWGRSIQNLRASHPTMHFVLPFLKTPVNVLRMAWKMTPALNMFQREYRDQFFGKMGREAQAQAMGQMALGTMYLGTAANLALGGRLTSGGPSDANQRKALMATGWQPYSFVLDRPDGTKTYVPFGRFDPIGLPFGIVADLVDMQHVAPGSKNVDGGILAASLAISKAFSERTFLMNINQVLELATNPDEDGTGLERYFGKLAGNLIPGSSAIRTYANQDPYLREARTFIDRMMADMPGYSDRIPPQRDPFGDPIWRKRGLTTASEFDIVESEHNRLILETGYGIQPPSPTSNGVDFRDVTLSDGRNAYDALQEMVAQPASATPPLKEALAGLIQSEAYTQLEDGASDVRGTKMWALMDIVTKYRQAGKAALLQKYPELRVQLSQRQLDVMARVRAKRSEQTTVGTPTTARGLLNQMGY